MSPSLRCRPESQPYEPMQFFLDVDGVLLNFEKSFARWLNHHYGFQLPDNYQTESWTFDDLLPQEQIKEAWRNYLESKYCATMDSLVDLERFNSLANIHDVHLVTNFPSQHADKRTQNLEHLGFAYNTLNFCGLYGYRGEKPRTKSQIITELRNHDQQALFIDDHPDNCLDVLENCKNVEVWVMSRRFNREFDHPHIRRAQDWGCLFERVAELEQGMP